MERLDCGLRRNDAKREFLTFYEFIKSNFPKTWDFFATVAGNPNKKRLMKQYVSPAVLFTQQQADFVGWVEERNPTIMRLIYLHLLGLAQGCAWRLENITLRVATAQPNLRLLVPFLYRNSRNHKFFLTEDQFVYIEKEFANGKSRRSIVKATKENHCKKEDL